MLRPITHTLISSFFVLASSSALARDINPGLWEMQNEMQGGILGSAGGAASEQMAAMFKQLENAPPHVRAIMEQQLGISGIGAGQGGGMKMSIRTCIKPEDIQDKLFENGKTDGDCTFNKVSQSGNVWKGAIVCKGEANASGSFTATLHSPDHYSMEMAMNSDEMGKVKMQMESRRVGDDCGNVGKGSPFGILKSQGQ
jgi:hypothetical protein